MIFSMSKEELEEAKMFADGNCEFCRGLGFEWYEYVDIDYPNMIDYDQVLCRCTAGKVAMMNDSGLVTMNRKDE